MGSLSSYVQSISAFRTDRSKLAISAAQPTGRALSSHAHTASRTSGGTKFSFHLLPP
jgi:hypothetical protein